jgi:hypothetical protein
MKMEAKMNKIETKKHVQLEEKGDTIRGTTQSI